MGGPFKGAGAADDDGRQVRTVTTLAYFTVEDRILIIGSYGARRDRRRVLRRRHASELAGDERDASFDKLVELAPVIGDYREKTTRVIPLFELQSVDGS